MGRTCAAWRWAATHTLYAVRSVHAHACFRTFFSSITMSMTQNVCGRADYVACFNEITLLLPLISHFNRFSKLNCGATRGLTLPCLLECTTSPVVSRGPQMHVCIHIACQVMQLVVPLRPLSHRFIRILGRATQFFCALSNHV